MITKAMIEKDAKARNATCVELAVSKASRTSRHPLTSRKYKSQRTVVAIGGINVGSKELVIMAGPCAV